MGFQPWVTDTSDPRLVFQPGSQQLRVFTVCTHAQVQCLKSLEEHPCIERAHARAGRAHESKYVSAHQRVAADDGTADTASLTIEVLGG